MRVEAQRCFGWGEDRTVDKKAVILAGIVVGLVGAGLAWLGNPPNMGLCVVCFSRDTAGALGLHRVSTVQYLRPEIMGFLLGSCLAAASRREWRARGGSSPVLRFFLGMAVAIGALIFLGCPLRMVLRLAGGDLTALYGFAGFAAGVYVGVLYLRAGYSLGRSQPQPRVNRYLAPLFALALLLLLVTRPSFVFFSDVLSCQEGRLSTGCCPSAPSCATGMLLRKAGLPGWANPAVGSAIGAASACLGWLPFSISRGEIRALPWA